MKLLPSPDPAGSARFKRVIAPHTPAGEPRPGRPPRSFTPTATEVLARLAATSPRTLACVHGASYRDEGAALLGKLSEVLSART